MQTRLIALAGTNGSGKDAVGLILAEQFGFMFISVTDLLRAELRRRNLPIIRENTRLVGNEWRRELGPGVLVDKAVAEFEATGRDYKGLVIASVRNPGEADRVHEFDGTMVWLDADPRLRYDRIQANAATRNRAGEDDRTFEQFLAEEEAEMHKPVDGDQASLDGAAVKDKCDVFITNEAPDLQALQIIVADALQLS